MIRFFYRALFLALGPFATSPGRRRLARWLLNAEVAESAELGICYIDAKRVILGPYSSVGHFTVIRNLDELKLNSEARLGTFNWIFGARGSRHFRSRPERRSALLLDEGASVTSRHIIDCTDTVEIGAFATLAGYRSQILTHSVDVISNCQDCEPVSIGPFSFIGTGAVVLKGAHFPGRSILAAGSVYSSKRGDEFFIYSGVPATPTKSLPNDAKYMHRKSPRVS